MRKLPIDNEGFSLMLKRIPFLHLIHNIPEIFIILCHLPRFIFLVLGRIFHVALELDKGLKGLFVFFKKRHLNHFSFRIHFYVLRTLVLSWNAVVLIKLKSWLKSRIGVFGWDAKGKRIWVKVNRFYLIKTFNEIG